MKHRRCYDEEIRQIELKNDEVERKVDEKANANNDQAMFKAVIILNHKHFENPKVEEKDGKLALNPNDVLHIVSTHFKNKFIFGPRC